MARICPVCDQPTNLFKSVTLKDGFVCNACFEKSGLKKAGFPPMLCEVWEVVTMCDMGDGEKQKRISEKREELRQMNEAAQARMETMAVHQSTPPVPTCPKCGSTVISADKKGVSVGKAALGAVVAGPWGLAAGGIGANKVRITCLNCGHQWAPGKK